MLLLRNAIVAGAFTTTDLAVTNNATVGNNLTVTGHIQSINIDASTTITAGGNISATGDLASNNIAATGGLAVNYANIGTNLTATGDIAAVNMAATGGLSATYVNIGQGLTVTGTIAAGALTANFVTFNEAIGNVTAPSDLRLKKDITALPSSLSKIMALRPVSYDWKNPTYGKSRQIGFIAQELRKHFPELVREDSKGMLSVNYAALVSPIVKSIQEQQDEIEALKKQNAELKKRLDDIEVLLKKIATQNK
jgi:hypothetical protein